MDKDIPSFPWKAVGNKVYFEDTLVATCMNEWVAQKIASNSVEVVNQDLELSMIASLLATEGITYEHGDVSHGVKELINRALI